MHSESGDDDDDYDGELTTERWDNSDRSNDTNNVTHTLTL